jgi:hypothetical protein
VRDIKVCFNGVMTIQIRCHLVLVKPIISPFSLKHFLQSSRSYLRMSPIWHLHLLHSRLSFPNLRGCVLQSKLGICGQLNNNLIYLIH